MALMERQGEMAMMPTLIAGRSNNQAGFTLIELALVVLLLGMLASLGLPMLSGLEPDRLNATARRLAGTVKYLYNEAAMTGEEHRLIFELEKDSYRTAQLSPTGELQTGTGLGKSYKLRDGVHFDSIYQPHRGEQREGGTDHGNSTRWLVGGNHHPSAQ